MESRVIKITAAAFKYGNLNLSACGKDFFPSDVFGSHSKKGKIGNLITLKIEGLNEIIQTDVPTDKNTSRPRWIFRERRWLKNFLSLNNLKEGDTITITRADQRAYEIIPSNGNCIQIEHKKCQKIKDSPVFENEKTLKVDKSKYLDIGFTRTCNCRPNNLNCLSPKEWLKSQLGVWQFTYEGRDIRDKKLHPATFPISLARKVIELFTHKGELVLDPFVGSGTTLIAAQDTDRNAVGFDLQKNYIKLSESRIAKNSQLFKNSRQIAICDEASHIQNYLKPETVGFIFTSPPYANLLNRPRKNKSRRFRDNDQLGKVEQYSQDPRDLGTMSLTQYTNVMGDIFDKLLPLLKPKAHCVINVPDMWWENKRITIHVSLIEELRRRGYELRNIIIWDRTNIVNRIGIFGWPSNYITMGVTFEYLLDFWKPPVS